MKEKRTKKIDFRVSDDEFNLISKSAKSINPNLKIGAYCRAVALNVDTTKKIKELLEIKKETPSHLLELIVILRNQNNNLNQITKDINKGNQANSNYLAELIISLNNATAEVKEMLLKVVSNDS